MLKVQDNIKRDANGNVEAVLCWCCAGVVAANVNDELVETRVVNGERIQIVRQKLRRLANYDKASFILDNGATYTPIVCKDCVPKVNVSTGDAILQRDLALHIRDKGRDDFSRHLAQRKVERKQ